MRPLCQKPPSPITEIGAAVKIGPDRCRARERHAIAENRIAQAERREGRESMAADVALICVGPSSRCISLMAENTGRSGQPVQKVGGRGGNAPTAAAAAGLCASMRLTRAAIASASSSCGRISLTNAARPLSRASDWYSPVRGSAPLPNTLRLHVGAPQLDVDLLLDVVGRSPPPPPAPRACRRRTRAPPPAPADKRH